MSDGTDLVITISANSDKAVDALKGLGEEVGGMDSALGTALTAAAAGFGVLVAAVGEGVIAFGKQEQASNQLANALQNQGLYSDELLKSYKEQADALEETTGASSTAIISGQALLQSMIGQVEITPELTKAVVDLAAAQGIGLQEAFQLVGKAIDGNTQGLLRHGIQMDDTGTRAGNLSKLVDLLGQKFGGAADQAAKGVGSFKLAEAALESMSRTIGEAFAPAAASAAAGFTRFINSVNGWLNSGKPTMDNLSTSAYDLRERILELEQQIQKYNAAGAFDEARVATTNLLALRRELGATNKALDKLTASQDANAASETKQDAGKAAAAAKQEQLLQAHEARVAQIKAASLAVQQAEEQGASKEVVALKKEELKLLEDLDKSHTAAERAIIQDRLNQTKALEQQAAKDDADREEILNNEILAKDEKFQAKSASEKKAYLAKNQTALKSSIQTEETTREAAQTKELEDQIKAHNQFLADQQQYGTAYAAINQAMHSAEVTGAEQAFSQLTQLQNSKNAELKAIGQVAAAADIVIKTAQAAMNIYQGFSTIPIIGPALGIAGAAAAIAYGAEQESNVWSAAEGGLVTGGIPGKDSVPSMLMPGELVVPTQNFDDVVSSYTASQNPQTQGQSGNGVAQVQLQFNGDFGRVVEASIVQRQRLGVSLLKKVT